MRAHSIARRTAWLAAVALLAPVSACNDILKVNNPAGIPIDNLNDSALLNAQVNGVIAELENVYTRSNGALLWSANFLTDEQVTGLNW